MTNEHMTDERFDEIMHEANSITMDPSSPPGERHLALQLLELGTEILARDEWANADGSGCGYCNWNAMKNSWEADPDDPEDEGWVHNPQCPKAGRTFEKDEG